MAEKNDIYEIFILNPQSDTYAKIRNAILGHGFLELNSCEGNSLRKYKLNGYTMQVSLSMDYVGAYITILMDGILGSDIRKQTRVCPECGSNNLRISVLPCWESNITEQLQESGRLTYGAGAYDRPGTLPETHTCLGCGCKWHNGAFIRYWNDIIKRGGELTVTELGLKDF